VLCVLYHRESSARGAGEGNGMAVVLAPALEKCVTDRTATRAPSAISYRFEHTADLGIFVRVSFAEIGRYRVDNDQHHVADGGDFLFQ